MRIRAAAGLTVVRTAETGVSAGSTRRLVEASDYVQSRAASLFGLAPIECTSDMVIRVSVCQSAQQGHIPTAQCEAFASLPPHVPAAVRGQMALEAAAVLAGAMEALSIAAFVCDGAGTVRALTTTAEALVRADSGLCLKLNRLCADDLRESQALDDAIAAAALADTPAGAPHRTIVVRGGRIETPPLVLEVVPLPRREYEHDLAPRVLVIARGARVPSERRASVVQAAYALTAAETHIAIQLGAGETPQAIAAARGVAVGTVRAQIKAICAKLGVRRQTELVARLNDL